MKWNIQALKILQLTFIHKSYSLFTILNRRILMFTHFRLPQVNSDIINKLWRQKDEKQ